MLLNAKQQKKLNTDIPLICYTLTYIQDIKFSVIAARFLTTCPYYRPALPAKNLLTLITLADNRDGKLSHLPVFFTAIR